MKPHPDPKTRKIQEEHPGLYKAVIIFVKILMFSAIAGILYFLYTIIR